MTKPAQQQLNIRIDPDLMQRIDAHLDRTGDEAYGAKSALVRKAIREFLERHVALGPEKIA